MKDDLGMEHTSKRRRKYDKVLQENLKKEMTWKM
jgi:hypothetical protein